MGSNDSARTLAGIDGCRDGWCVVVSSGGTLSARIEPTFEAVIRSLPVTARIAVDIPIGLTDAGPRGCDRAARELLGTPRRSSVFSAPVRGVLGITTHERASARHRRIDGRGLSIQAFAIMPKIAEVDACLQRERRLRARVFEIHPEVSLAVWNGGTPMQHRKVRVAGREERQALIERAWPGERERLWNSLEGDVQHDDLNDAFAALWSAQRIVAGTAKSFPESPLIDSTGLPMRILA